jgi:two-component system cell cycle sensor histidine kinase/response regulator CckA
MSHSSEGIGGTPLFCGVRTMNSDIDLNKTENWRSPDPGQTVVLVVEDEVVVRNLARMVLELEGYFVLTADNGEKALDICRRYPSIIHAAVSGVNLPEMDGRELRQRILTERPGIKVLLTWEHTVTPVENAPFLQKPFGPTALKGRIKQLLASASA